MNLTKYIFFILIFIFMRIFYHDVLKLNKIKVIIF